MTNPPVAPDELLLIGRIIGVVGLRGQMRMRLITTKFDHLQRRVRRVFVGAQQTPHTLTGVNFPKPGVAVIALADVTSREQAELLRGSDVLIHQRDAAPLDTDEYFIHELYDLMVVTEAGEELGRVREVLETGANEVLVVQRRGAAEALIPMIRDVVVQLDIPAQRIVIRPIDGLL
jgi:16S rRNA processing protein RimM